MALGATEKLQFVLDLDASKAIRGAQTAGNRIDRELSPVDRRLDRVGGSLRKTGAGAVAFAGVATAAFTSAAAVVTDFADTASQLEQSVGATESVFGAAAGAVDDFAARSVDAAGLSERAYRELASVAGAQLKSLGFSVGEAAETSNELIEIGADLSATFGGTTQEAVEALGAAFRGEADPAERFGLRLNQAAVNAKAVELGLAESASAVDGHAKAQATLALILEQSADSVGQFAREADTLAGAQQRATAQFENAKAALGEQFLPVVTDATVQLSRLADVVTDSEDRWGSLAAFAEQGLTNALDAATFGLTALARSLAGAAELTDEQKTAMIEAAGAADEWEVVGGKVVRVTDRATEASRGHAEALDEQAKALENMVDDMRAAVDPLFAVVNADRKLAEAQAKLTELQDSGTASSAELAAANLRVAEAAGDMEQASISLASAVQAGTASVDSGRATLQRWVAQGLITQAQANVVAAAFDHAGARARALGAHSIVVRARADTSSFDAALAHMQRRANQGILVAVRAGQVIARQHGGPFGARQPMLVGEAGPELVAFNQPGRVIPNRVIPNSRLTHAAGAGGGTFVPVINVSIHGRATREDGEEVVRALIEYQRRNGNIPVKIA